jgi:hypothetical protein
LDRRIIALVWLGGALLMAAVYAIGPQHFLAHCEALVLTVARYLNELAALLMQRALEAVRAAAIAFYVVFFVLAVLAMQRGLRLGGMLLGVSVVFLLLVRTEWYDAGTKWLAAALLTLIAASATTKRLLYTRPQRDHADPWGTAYRRDGGKGSRPP